MTLSRTIKISNYSYAGEWRILAPWLPNARTTPAQPPHNPPHNPPGRQGWGIGNSVPILFQDPWRTGSTAGRGSTTGKAGAEEALTLSWTMLFEMCAKVRMTHSRTMKIYGYS